MSVPKKYYQPAPIARRVWFLALRTIVPILLIGSSLIFLKPISFNYLLLATYGLLTILLLVSVFLLREYAEKVTRIIIIALISCELLIEGLLVNHVGGNISPFILFFILTIVTASLFFRLLGSIVVASLAGLLYAMPIFFNLSFIYEGIIESTRLAGMGLSSDEAFYMVFLHLCLFYMCAFISGYLAENLFLASRELSKIRLETNEILEQMRSGMMSIDCHGRIIYFNRAAGEILAIDHLHAKGKLVWEFFHSGLNQLNERLESALRDGLSISRAEINIKNPGRGLIPIGISLSILKGSENETRGIIAIFQDLTEAKKLEAHMRASDRLAAVGQLAAGIAHEIRNPLAAISGSVEILKETLELQGDDLRLLQLILKESSRLNTILTDFLNFARVTRISSGRCDLAAVIREMRSLASTHSQIGGSIIITQKLHSPSIMVTGSEGQLKQILWNLILNASQAMEGKGGKIEIITQQFISEDNIEFIKMSVADNGPGIPDGVKERIFDPFFSTKEGGTGLGLPIVARIVGCLNGKIELESSEMGTTFILYLPQEKSGISEDKMLEEVSLI